jgi:glycosyltransferase 2 family protein
LNRDDRVPTNQNDRPQGLTKKRAVVIFRLLISIGILTILINNIDVSHAIKLFKKSYPWYIVLAIFVAMFSRLVTAYRWYILIQHLTRDINYWYLARLTFISNFIGTFLPGTIGVDAVRGYGLAKTVSNSSLSISTLVVERAIGVIIMLLLVVIGAQFAPEGLPGAIQHSAILGLFFLTICIVLISNSPVRKYVREKLRKLLPYKLFTKISSFFTHSFSYFKSPKLLAISMVIAVLMQLLRVIQLYLGACALNLDVDFFYFLIFAPIVTFIIQIPISIGGIGVREGAYIFLFGLAGVTSEDAFAISMMYFLVGFVATLPGAAFYANKGLTHTIDTKTP